MPFRSFRLLALALLVSAASLAAADEPAPSDQPMTAIQTKKKVKKSKSSGGKKEKSAEAKRREMIESGAKTAIEWYGDALQYYKKGRYLDARSILLPLEDSARAVDIQEKVKLLIADTYFEQGGALNLAEALARYKSFLTFFPGSEHAAYAQYQLGRSYFKQLGEPTRDQSFTDQAIFEYQKLIDSYPDSDYVTQAKKDILEAKARRAQHEFEVAKFYWDWNDKTAAAERLKTVLKERPELPEREKALYMAAQSLYDTGKRDEGDAYAERLKADYPKSQYISHLNPNSAGAIAKQAERDRKRDKELERTHRAQAKADRRRTRIVRKDSGLPADVPQTWEAPATASAPAAPDHEAEARKQKSEEKLAKERAEGAKLEAEEKSAAAKEDARKQKREAAHAKEAEKREAKHAKEQEALANETPEQKADREKKEAQEKKEADRLEAEEARQKAKDAEHQKKLDAERAKEEAKKAKKKAAKKK